MKTVRNFLGKRTPPWFFNIPIVLVVIGVLVPLLYLGIRAFGATPTELAVIVFRYRNLELLGNTMALAVGVLLVDTLLALPLAYLSTRIDIPFRKWITIIGVLPLAIPSYVMAYALMGLGGYYGTLNQWLGLELARLSGFSGSLIVLSLCTFPYLYLNLRTAMLGIDPSIEEASRSLGYDAKQTFVKIILPQLRPAFYAGGLLVFLHVLGDFGTVSLMRFETFSYALYIQYMTAYDRIYAAWLALMLLGLTTGALFLEYRLLKRAIFHRLGSGAQRAQRLLKISSWKAPALVFVGLILLIGIILPVASIAYWINQQALMTILPDLGTAFWNSVRASAPAAFITVLLAVPLAYVGVRYPSRWTKLVERISYLGYATPPLAFALAFVFFSLYATPVLYQSLALLIIAYALHFLAEAIGPIRSALYQASPKLEEAAQSLGVSRWMAFVRVILPMLQRGMIASMALVFLSAMKELSITFLLSPTGFSTLAVNVWSYANEAMFAEAAPYAISILLFSSFFVGLLFTKEFRS
ncbi:MAG: ABC transporter permease [Bacteroidota bacterium]